MTPRRSHSQCGDHARPLHRNRKRFVLLILGVAVVVVLLLILYPHAKVAYLAYRVEAAETAQEEWVAFVLLNKWSPHGTTVTLLDANGDDLGPEGTFDYADVHAVEVKWPCGRAVRRRLLDNINLVPLLGE